ncbi:hypothetical protein ACW6QP_09795 [Salegentibacter sp. HM20]
MDFDLQNRKLELIQWLSTLNDESIIKEIIKLREKERVDWWEEISLEEQKSIELGINDADAGKLKPHSEARKLYEKWL